MVLLDVNISHELACDSFLVCFHSDLIFDFPGLRRYKVDGFLLVCSQVIFCIEAMEEGICESRKTSSGPGHVACDLDEVQPKPS